MFTLCVVVSIVVSRLLHVPVHHLKKKIFFYITCLYYVFCILIAGFHSYKPYYILLYLCLTTHCLNLKNIVFCWRHIAKCRAYRQLTAYLNKYLSASTINVSLSFYHHCDVIIHYIISTL